MKHVLGLSIVLALVTSVPMPAVAVTSESPSLEARIAARRAVEDVLWRHRIWPADNPNSKPPLSVLLPDSELRARVLDDLRKSQALATLWSRPITGAMLQAELDRMRAGSRAPEVLEEMLGALGNDPVLAREAIARPALVDRLIRSWYSHDERFHGALKQQADAGSSGAIVETTWVKRGRPSDRQDNRTVLDSDEWTEMNASLESRFGTSQLRAGMVTPVVDEDDAFRMYVVRASGDGIIKIGVASWPKRTFESWWASTGASFAPELAVPKGDVVLAPQLNTPGSCANDTWHPLGNVTPLQRYSHSAVWTGSEMIVWGGWTPFGVTSTGGRYAPATDSWYPTSPTGAPSARVGHPAVWTGTEMIVWGGQQSLAGPYGPLGDGARYAPLSDTWTPITNSGAPAARRQLTMVWTGSRVIVFGGRDESTPTNTGGRYDPGTDTWAPTSTVGAPVARSGHAAVWTGNVMVVWGGTGGNPTNTGGRYDPLTDSWQSTATSGAPAGRFGHTAIWTGTRMIVWGGASLPFIFNDGGRYDPSTDTWASTSTFEAAGNRTDHTAVWTGSRMIVWGGWGLNMGTETATGGRYDPATDTWTAVATTAGVPERRRSHTAVWTGTEMIVWGGVWELPTPFIAYLNTGGRYDPATDSWVPTSVRTVGPPDARENYTSVWTGTETIFWGGVGLGGVNVGDGARYSAATDSWSQMSAVGAPSPRNGHAAVWTGTEMVLWGGSALTTYFNSGGRYQPASDAWSVMSTAGAPSGRTALTAVWTGSRVIVWGGNSPSFAITGGRYDPASDTWAATSVAGAPQARSGHTAVWTGSRMVVWGGLGGVVLGTGGRYDPIGDTWAATSMNGAPSARMEHVSVWTGSRMLVWGGNASDLLGDGAGYDPVGDTWTAMSAVGAPAARRLHGAVWSGSEMLIWGGVKSDGGTNTGGRYLPSADSWLATSTAGAPSARTTFSAVWAGDKMLVWGGHEFAGSVTNTGASYCACRTFWRDDDGDGYGNGDGGAPTMETCDGTTPAGWVDNGLDCWDANSSVHPGALDNTCNGVDEDCNGTPDDLWIGGLSHCGLGVCGGLGIFECVAGQVVNNCTPGTPTATTDVLCNGLDDDCDGAVDEDFVQYQDSWSAIASGPTIRTNQSAVWTGAELIVFGGDNGSGTVKAGGEAYAPATNSWRNLATGPAKRWHHTAVWTGSRMVVWGGDDNTATVYNTGSRYDPVTDTWAATTTTGAPSARGGHSAVWTGSRMIVWGGSDSVSTFNTGSRYDPSANAWVATATAGAPTLRLFHTAVWTGTEMIVWGGQSAPGTGGALATGGRYNPTTNTWVATATSGAPSARYGNVAVWTGTEMLIWGGTNGTSYSAGGARYNPVTNAWSLMSTVGAPSQRAWASAAWTGTELIVWGGMYKTNEVPDTALADGARYSPATDTWTAITPYSAPAARARASAVWSGTELIVWGGDPVGAARSDGSRYSLQTLCGTGGCQRTGATYCAGGVVGFQCVPATATPEICDGIDNNCNVMVDEGIPAPTGHPTVFTAKLDAAGTTVFTWSVTADTTHYDVTRGMLGALRSTAGNFAAATIGCTANDASSPSAQDTNVPAVGDGLWYLVRPVNSCSGVGTYDDAQPPQQGSRDAEILASGVACP